MLTGDPMCYSCGQYWDSHWMPCPQDGGAIGYAKLHNHLDGRQEERYTFLQQEYLALDQYTRGLEEHITYIQTISTEQVATIRQLQAMLRVSQIQSR